jgi:hypothetical protein
VSTGLTYWWGCVGGFVSAIALYVIPELTRVATTGKSRVRVTKRRVWATIFLIAMYTLTGGIAPLLFDHPDRAHTIGYGLAGQVIIKGVISSFRDALKPEDPAVS